ncbi:MAG TPA: hypothetical protein VF533_06160 [Solirubrobacteraceae bacterium]|jgi:hypothetical protein
MRRAAAIALAVGAGLAAPAAAPAATVDVMVVGKERVLFGPREVTLKQRRVKVGKRRCAVGRATPLSALAGTGLKLKVRDYGSCSRSPRDAGLLFVRRIAEDANRGRAGWVYKVGRRSGTAGAADPSGSFGTGRRLHDGQRVLWFYCRLRGSGSCQRTLEVRPAERAVGPGEPLSVSVRGYDDEGRGKRVEGATVTLGDQTATTGPEGTATLTAPPRPGRVPLSAQRDGLVPSFPSSILIR